MWAAGSVERFKSLIIGQPAKRVSTIDSVDLKQGSTGTLVFVNVKHDIYQDDATFSIVFDDSEGCEGSLRGYFELSRVISKSHILASKELT